MTNPASPQERAECDCPMPEYCMDNPCPMPRYASLRDGGNLPQPRPIGWHWIALVLAGFAIAGLGLALLLGGIEAYAAEPGMDICSTKGC